MRFLSLDIGTRRTGIAFADETIGIALPLDTIVHTSLEELLERVGAIAIARAVDQIIVGHPLLLSGEEGSQATYVRSFLDMLHQAGFSAVLADERYTTPHQSPSDGDAAAACTLLMTALRRRGQS